MHSPSQVESQVAKLFPVLVCLTSVSQKWVAKVLLPRGEWESEASLSSMLILGNSLQSARWCVFKCGVKSIRPQIIVISSECAGLPLELQKRHWVPGTLTEICLRFFSYHDKIPQQEQLKGERVSFSLQLRGQSTMVGKSRLEQWSMRNACLLVPAHSLPEHPILTSIDGIKKITQRPSSTLPQVHSQY